MILPPERQKKCDDMSIHLHTVPALDRQTDRQTDRIRKIISRCACLGMLTRDKNDDEKNSASNKFYEMCNLMSC